MNNNINYLVERLMNQHILGLPSKTGIIEALLNQQESQQTANSLLESSKCPGYAILLIRIVDEENITADIRCKVLLQLQRHLRQNWRGERNSITTQEKQQIKAIIISSIFRAPLQYRALKTYRQVLELIISYEFQNDWNPLSTIAQKIRNGQSIPHCMQIILSTVAVLQFNVYEYETTLFDNLMSEMLLAFLQAVGRCQSRQANYFGMKFIYKVSSPALKQLVLDWMPLLLSIIGQKNQVLESKANEIHQKWSQQFYYFHSKKWATRMLLKFIQKQARRQKLRKHRSIISFHQRWYNNFGDRFIELLVEQFSVNTTKKTRYFQLKCIQSLISHRQEKMKQYAEIFQLNILCNYLRLDELDRELALKSPNQFIKKDTEPSLRYQQLRHLALDVWIKFSQMGYEKRENKFKIEQNNPQEFVRLFESLGFIQSKLQSNNQFQKELGLYLISSMIRVLNQCYKLYENIQKIIVKHVIPNFQHPNILVKSRALEVFEKFGFVVFNDKVSINQSINSLSQCILQEQHPIVQIKGIAAVASLAKTSEAKKLVAPIIKQTIEAVMKLIQKYRSQDIANNLQTIVSELGLQIAPFALSFIQSLYKFYFNTIKCEDEISKEDNSNQDCPSAASMCLKFITIILQYPLEQHVIVQSQSMVIELIQSVFLTYPQDIGAALILLKAYLLKAQFLNERLFFFYQITIFNLIGDSFMKFQSFAMELEQRYACLLDKVRKNNNIEMFEQSFQPIRIYISKVSLMALENNYESFKNRLICRLFHLINESYKMGRQMYIGNINIALSTSLMMSLLQNFKYSLPKNIYVQIWEFSKINMIKYQSIKLKSINSQLFGILLSLEPQIILNIVQRQNMMQNAMRLITTLNYYYSYERTRIIEGINQILLLQDKPAFIMSFIKDLFMANLRLVRQNIDQYLQIQRAEEQQDVSQSQDVRQSRSVNQDNSSDLDHQWWEQSAFQGRLQDENVCLFRFEEILLSISNEENDLSKDLIRSVPEQNIAILKHKFQLLRLQMSQENHNK